jgi:hypothetical protein
MQKIGRSNKRGESKSAESECAESEHTESEHAEYIKPKKHTLFLVFSYEHGSNTFSASRPPGVI